MKTEIELIEYVKQFNEVYPIGSSVDVLLDNGNRKNTTVKESAIVLYRHSAVAWFDGISGAYSIDRVVGCQHKHN